MKLHLEITYTRPPETDKECADGYTAENPMPIGSMLSVDITTEEGKAFLRESFEEFMAHLGPDATFHVGGVCRCYEVR